MGRAPRFRYVDDRTGRRPSDADLERIRRLAIPPAWTDVWIAADEWSHLQATGRDAKGRKQYRYHAAHTEAAAARKFDDLVAFGGSLGRLRRRVRRDLAATDLRHDQVVAVVVRLLDITSLRVGNEEYAATNESFGLTTLRDHHVKVRGSTVNMDFTGKSRHHFEVRVEDRRLARLVRRCQELPGQQLFQYVSGAGGARAVGSSDVNEYLGRFCRPGVTAKTFRPWNATVLAAHHFAATDSSPSKRVINEIIDAVADELGNTRAVCRSSYVHPVVVAGFEDGSLRRSWRRPVASTPRDLGVDERRTLRYLRSSAA